MLYIIYHNMKRNSPSIEKKRRRFGRNIFKIFFSKTFGFIGPYTAHIIILYHNNVHIIYVVNR